MAYTVTQLINNSYYLSGIVARNLQTTTGAQIEDGLTLLNALLATKTAGIRLIPYFQEYDLTLVTGQEMYFIPNLVEAETFTFNIGSVRYSTLPTARKAYFGSPRVDNIQSLPYDWHIERVLGGANLFMYFLPDVNYPAKIWGKFSLASVALGQDLSLTLDAFYIEYLRVALAEQICAEFNIPMQPQAAMKLAEYEKIIMDVSPPDLSMQKMSSLGCDQSLNWADINIGRGWRP